MNVADYEREHAKVLADAGIPEEFHEVLTLWAGDRATVSRYLGNCNAADGSFLETLITHLKFVAKEMAPVIKGYREKANLAD